ncbi:response regulator transcription factor [Litoribacter alkaliphilus]|uniref:Response regulator transcription factor n=1 Tax=Litoribacter ruber TaxID=702568 RepID=A0AAP2CLX0_9BACT|nr:LytTR family DNA-binding domain-containing protein [Litoribacter alkaliphilus]MBS9525701.1 response regulator transcription factor [Litoribacter alkaliphilus]
MTEFKYNVAIIDDEQHVLDLVKMLISDMEGFKLKLATTDPEKFILGMNSGVIDIGILDVRMPKYSGSELAAIVMATKCPIIFISGTEVKAKEIIPTEPVDFLEKPIMPDRLEIALRKAVKRITGITGSRHNISPLPSDEVIYLSHSGKLVKIRIQDIQSIHAGQDFNDLYTEKSKYSITGSLANLEDRLKNYDIIRVHNSYLVNTSNVITIKPNLLTLKNGQEIPISRKYKTLFLKTLKPKIL